MSKPDKNFVSLVGRSHETVAYGDLCPPDGSYSDTLKVTACRALTVTAGHIVGSAEDAVDINNHCSSITVVAGLFEPRGKYLATIKGGSSGVMLIGKVRGHGSVTDIDIGNISDQSDNLTRGVVLDLEHELGRHEPIRVRVLGGTRPVLMNASGQRYDVEVVVPGFFRSWFLKGYKLLKRLGLPI